MQAQQVRVRAMELLNYVPRDSMNNIVSKLLYGLISGLVFKLIRYTTSVREHAQNSEITTRATQIVLILKERSITSKITLLTDGILKIQLKFTKTPKRP